MAEATQPRGPAAARYNALIADREPYLTRAREAAALTLPDLFPDNSGEHNRGQTGSSRLKTPWNSVGSRGVNNLSSKLLLALFPPNQSFFKMSLDEAVLREQAEEQGVNAEDFKVSLDQAFSQIEQTTNDFMESASFRVTAHEALRLLVVSGNALLFIDSNGKPKVFRLDRYVVKRDLMGNVLEIVVKETTAINALPEEIREVVKERTKQDRGVGELDDRAQVDIYTHVKLKPGKTKDSSRWQTYQEVAGEKVPDSEGTHRLDRSPWIPLRFIRVDGEDYGRGYVEEYMGDLRSLNSLTKAIVQSAHGAAKQLWWVRPGAILRPRDLQKESGSVVVGEEGDAGVYRADKMNDQRSAQEVAAQIEQRLSMAFLLANPRDAERVTAEEIRMLASMLEDALGGIYSVLSHEFQRPLVNRYISVLSQNQQLPQLPSEFVKIKIATGIDALGRNHELQKLQQALGHIQQTLGPEVAARYLGNADYIKKVFASLGVSDEVIKSEQQVRQELQASRQQALAEKAAPQAVNQAGKLTQQAVDQQTTEQQQ